MKKKLWQALQENYPDISAIVISHRLSTLHYVDSVLLCSQGSAYKGSHDYLVLIIRNITIF